MFIPIGTDRPTKRRPRVVEALIVLNMLVYLAGLAGDVFGGVSFETLTNWMMLSRGDFHWWNLITYQFAHNPSDILHLVFNMVGLWIFGTSLEGRLGHANFLVFYLVGGCIAGIAHMMETAAPVIGASGSVCALIGGFIALFPRSRIRILLLFIMIGVFEVGSLWVVGFYVLIDFVGWVAPSGSTTAYVAPIAGYLYGFLLAILLLWIRLLKSDDFDMVYLWKQARRRSAFRRTIRQNPTGTWDTTASPAPPPVVRLNPEEQARRSAIGDARSRIHRLVRQGRFEDAGAGYLELLDLDPDAVLTEAAQLELANRLYAEGDRTVAATAYERFLEHYPRSDQNHEVALILSLLYIRVLDRPDDAATLLDDVATKLHDDAHRSLANSLLEELRGTGPEPAS